MPNLNSATNSLIGPGNAVSPLGIQGAAIPEPNLSTTPVGAGNAARLFPVITPAPTPSPGLVGADPVAEHSVSPAGQAVGVVTSAPATPVLGLIGLVVAFLLVMTRRPARRRTKYRPRHSRRSRPPPPPRA